jgi:redox-sensing transcriptional repressor
MHDVESPETIEHPIPEQTLRRIPLYHQILGEMQARGESYVSSRHLAQFFRIDDTQVRKDVSLIGYKGKPKAGYSILGLSKAIEEFLGINYENTAILIGAGRLGAFTILPMESLPRVVRSFDVGMAIVCVPKDAAPSVAARIVSLGIKAIWNFSPTQLTVPADVVVRNENIAIGFAILSHYLKRRKKDDHAPGAPGRENPPQQLIDLFSRYQPKREYLVQILEDAQRLFGHLSRETVGYVADYLNVTREQVLESAAFYPVFRLEPPALYRISVCRGESCGRKGATAIFDAIAHELHIADGESSPDGRFRLEAVPCQGRCSDGPTVIINDQVIPAADRHGLIAHIQELARSGS